MKLTEEQADILETIQKPDVSLLKVSAIAGAGKTATLVALSNLFRGRCLYLAYNKAIATEASGKFGQHVQCKTTHSLAYGPIVKEGRSKPGIKQGPRKVDWFNWKSITERVDYDMKLEVIAAMDEFFLSAHTSMSTFFDEDYDPAIAALAKKYILAMVKKEIPVTHSFYMKYYHILIASGVITFILPYDLIMLDEAGDLNPVTLEIFKLLPAKKKVMVGDPQQNIYSFNHTINGFKALADYGEFKTLTRSFRCSPEIAKRIEMFGQKYLDPKMQFKGTEDPDKEIRSAAIIARTNGTLVGTMIQLNETKVPFNLTRPAKEVFALLLILISLKPGAKIFDKRYKHLLEDMNDYYSSAHLQKKYSTLIGYIGAVHSKDIMIKSSVTTLLMHGGRKIITAYELAQTYEKSKTPAKLTLTTAHSSKGLEWDKVTLANDMNVDDIIETPQTLRSAEDQEELRLYYVAASRARKELINATNL